MSLKLPCLSTYCASKLAVSVNLLCMSTCRASQLAVYLNLPCLSTYRVCNLAVSVNWCRTVAGSRVDGEYIQCLQLTRRLAVVSQLTKSGYQNVCRTLFLCYDNVSRYRSPNVSLESFLYVSLTYIWECYCTT